MQSVPKVKPQYKRGILEVIWQDVEGDDRLLSLMKNITWMQKFVKS